MGYEIDFLAVGEESKSGDAITIRFGDLLSGDRQKQYVIIVDGGFSETGDALVNHIKTHYKTSIVDLVILTHADNDHSGGLAKVLDELTVKELWMHKPWDHTDGKAILFEDGRITDKSIEKQLQESLETAHSLQKIAERKKISIKEPFYGLVDRTGAVQVLGPSQEFFNKLIPEFSGLPEPKVEAMSSATVIGKAVEALKRWINELWDKDSIVDDGETTSAQNNSSAIIQISVDGKSFLFTGDAGREALTDVTQRLGINGGLPGLAFMQIPHHGSFRNIGPTVLNKIVGEIKPQGHKPHFSAYVSAAKGGAPKHPSKKVLNAFTRRGASVHVTAGLGKHFYSNAPYRDGWSTATPEPFYGKFEEL